jgi:hypothetical protein
MEYELNIGQVDVSQLETDDDFRREAQRLLPQALTQIGEKVGEGLWDEMQKALEPLGGTSSPADKAEFIRDAANEYRSDPANQLEVEQVILGKLRQMKSDAS